MRSYFVALSSHFRCSYMFGLAVCEVALLESSVAWRSPKSVFHRFYSFLLHLFSCLVYFIFIVPFSLALSFINSFLIFHSNFPIVLGPPGLILWSEITSSEDSHARNAWGVCSFNFNNFLLCFKIKLTVALARKHIIFFICVCAVSYTHLTLPTKRIV